jgi:hypothetical protein
VFLKRTIGRHIAIIGADGVGVSHSSSLICISRPPAAGHEWVIIAVSRSAPLGDHYRRGRLVAGEQPRGVARDDPRAVTTGRSGPA